ncbi:hypothetical protein ABZ743_31190 [Streptomyces sp. NPDC006662]|uniref:hypothetical protein n=1 Tax=Streptomyces sp. NPDC006662 TaxID=3156902 RepID=UPI0033C58198
MRFVITDDNGTVLATVEPPSEGATSINIEREDRPDLLFASADLYGSDGSVHVGHWPGGGEWETLLHTTGVPNPYGSGGRAAPTERVSAQEIANLTADLDLDEDALDEAVHEAFAEQASELNNQGATAQVEYLASGCPDVHALRDLLLGLTS